MHQGFEEAVLQVQGGENLYCSHEMKGDATSTSKTDELSRTQN